MSYTVLASAAVVVAVALDVAVLRTRLVARRVYWVTYAIVLAFQLLVNGLLTGWGVVRYDPASIIGFRIVYAPVEDLFFGFALVTTTLAMWVWLGRRSIRRTRDRCEV